MFYQSHVHMAREFTYIRPTKTSNKEMSLFKRHFPCRGILSSLFKIVEIQKFHYHGKHNIALLLFSHECNHLKIEMKF